MKYIWETSEKETLSMVKIIDTMFRLMGKGQQQRHTIALERLQLERDRFEFEKKKWNEGDEEWDDEDHHRPEPILAFDNTKKSKKKSTKESKPPVQHNIPLKKAIPPLASFEVGEWNEVNLTDHQKLGKKLIGELLNSWLINWGEEGQQPNRFELLHELSIHAKHGGAVVSYCMVVKGISVAVHNVLTYTDPDYDTDRSRMIAANITQVASCVFSQLADQYKYPNPLDKFTPTKEIKNESI